MRAEERIPNERLRQARKLKGWTQSKLAKVLETDFETVSRWERGVIAPSLYYQKKLADVLEKTTEELGLLVEHYEESLQQHLPGVTLVASYADRELEVCVQLKAELQVRGIQVIGNRSFRKLEGEQKQKMLREVFHATRVVVLLVSPHTCTSRHVREALPIAKIYKRAIYAVWLAGECWQQCLPMGYEDLVCVHDIRASCDVEKIVKELEEVWLAHQETPMPPETPPDLPEPRNPYKGLKAFGNEDREDFFGRDQLIEELVEGVRVSLMPGQANRLLAVVGPSGSGKSSVVLAGLVPRLQVGALPGSAEWLYLDPMVPGQNPLASLAQILAMFLPERSLQTLREDLEDDSTRGLHLLAGMIVKRSGAKVLLCIDQFEEVFTQTSSQEEREQFLAVLMTAITEPDGPVILILTMRSDFDDRPMSYPRLSTLMEARRHPVLPMTLNELQMTIEKPAIHPNVQLTFEGTLMSDLLFDVYGQEGALPLLQFTLDLLFQKRNGHLLTQQAYEEIGGVKGALAKHAEDTYGALPSEEHRKLARVLFLRLLDPGMTEQDTTRRRAAQIELEVTNPEQTRMLQETANAFIRARLLTTNDVANTSTVEVSHEALIREWKRISDWLHAAREDIRVQQTISKDVIEWERHRHSKDRLYRGSQLREARAWAKRSLPSKSETIFLRASAGRRRRSLVNVVVIFLLLMSTTGMVGWLLSRDPTRVTTLKDGGAGSLREAIDAANSGDTITFDPALSGKTIVIGHSLDISKNLTIRGPDAGSISISVARNRGDHILRVFPDSSVIISGLAFKNSKVSDFDGFGPTAIVNAGILTLISCTISHNGRVGINNGGTLTLQNSIVSANSGTGIANGGTLTLQNSIVSANGDTGVDNSGTLTLQNSIVSANRNGGIYSWTGTVTLIKSAISYNIVSAVGSSSASGSPEIVIGGGGINNGSKLIISNSTITHNTASTGTRSEYRYDSDAFMDRATGVLLEIAGGIANSGTLTLTSSTISNNTVSSVEGEAPFNVVHIINNGGGITNSGKLTLIKSTLTGNRTVIHGFTRARFMSNGGIANARGKATIIRCTITGNSNVGQAAG
jgi:transcriptional regulator with XRE-family HTH domain